LYMRRFWRVALPIFGLLLFSLVSWHSFRVNREEKQHLHVSNKYFYWSAIRLDTDPANRRNWDVGKCKETDENCWEVREGWIDPGLLDRFLLLIAFPVFVLGRVTVRFFGTMGINKLTSFLLLMPVLLLVWFYFVGWALDFWLHRRPKRSAPTPGSKLPALQL
jgi:hypothetical protein